jgi:uncharacterized protein YqgV (UPF0045/DUF77 family)
MEKETTDTNQEILKRINQIENKIDQMMSLLNTISLQLTDMETTIEITDDELTSF